MEPLIPLFRLAHFAGLALMLGGIVCSMILVRADHTPKSIRSAWSCIHLVASPGLMLLLITGILQSSAMYWQHFKGAGYMHAKVALAVVVLVLMTLDMKTQKRIIKNSELKETLPLLIKRQRYALSSCIVTLLIMLLIIFRPF